MAEQQDQAKVQQNFQDQPDVLPDSSVKRILLEIPPFNKQDSDLWFDQLEARFASLSIVNGLTKYQILVSFLESDALLIVQDLILKYPANNSYEAIKQRLVHFFSSP